MVEKLIITMPIVKLSWSQILVSGLFVVIEGPRFQIFSLGFLRLFICQFCRVAVHAFSFVIPDLILDGVPSPVPHSKVRGRTNPYNTGVAVRAELQRAFIDTLNELDPCLALITALFAVDNLVLVYRHNGKDWIERGVYVFRLTEI